MLLRDKSYLSLKWSDKHWKERQINRKGRRARILVSVLGGYTEYKSLHAYRSSDTCRNLGLPLSCSASTWDWMWLSAWDLARLKTAQWHFPALQCTDRTELIAIDTYFRFNFIAFCCSLLQQQCKREHKDNRVQHGIEKLQSRSNEKPLEKVLSPRKDKGKTGGKAQNGI